MPKATITFEDSPNGKLVATKINFEPAMKDPILLSDLSFAQRVGYEAFLAVGEVGNEEVAEEVRKDKEGVERN